MSVKPASVLLFKPTEIYPSGRLCVGIKFVLFRMKINTLSELQKAQMFLLGRITSWLKSVETNNVSVRL